MKEPKFPRRSFLLGAAALPLARALPATGSLPISAAVSVPPPPPPHMLAMLFDAANKIPDFIPPTSKDATLMATDWDFEGEGRELLGSKNSLAHEWVVQFNDAKHMAEVIDWMRDTAKLYPDFDFRWLTSLSPHGNALYEMDFEALTQANLGKKGQETHWKDNKQVAVTVPEDGHFKTNLAFMADKLDRLPKLRDCRTLTEAADYLQSLLPSYFDSKLLPPLRFPLPVEFLSKEHKLSDGITPTFRTFLESPPPELRESLSHFSKALKLSQSPSNGRSLETSTGGQTEAPSPPSLAYELLHPIRPTNPHSDRRYSPTENCTDQHPRERRHSPVAQNLPATEPQVSAHLPALPTATVIGDGSGYEVCKVVLAPDHRR